MIAPAQDVHVLPANLHALTRTIFERAGWNARDAALAADHLVLSNLSGHDSHGVGMVPRYLLSAGKGLLKIGPTLTTVVDAGALLTLDGGMGLGQVVGHDAMVIAIQRARLHGVAVLSLRNTHHLGRIGHWGEQAAAAGLVSMHYVNVIGRPALVAPWGGSRARFSTNPVCVAYPRPGREPIVLDFATSRIAHGKTRVAWKRGVPVADGNLLDATGHPTNDPSVMWMEPLGALLPFGDHKGYCPRDDVRTAGRWPERRGYHPWPHGLGCDRQQHAVRPHRPREAGRRGHAGRGGRTRHRVGARHTDGRGLRPGAHSRGTRTRTASAAERHGHPAGSYDLGRDRRVRGVAGDRHQ